MGEAAGPRTRRKQLFRSATMSSILPPINRIAQIMGGDVAGAEALVQGIAQMIVRWRSRSTMQHRMASWCIALRAITRLHAAIM